MASHPMGDRRSFESYGRIPLLYVNSSAEPYRCKWSHATLNWGLNVRNFYTYEEYVIWKEVTETRQRTQTDPLRFFFCPRVFASNIRFTEKFQLVVGEQVWDPWLQKIRGVWKNWRVAGLLAGSASWVLYLVHGQVFRFRPGTVSPGNNICRYCLPCAVRWSKYWLVAISGYPFARAFTTPLNDSVSGAVPSTPSRKPALQLRAHTDERVWCAVRVLYENVTESETG